MILFANPVAFVMQKTHKMRDCQRIWRDDENCVDLMKRSVRMVCWRGEGVLEKNIWDVGLNDGREV